jgi:hypothetical protein
MKSYKRTTRRELEKRARQLLRNPLFLYMLLERIRQLGVVGEERNLLILALACLTRTLPRPASVLVKGPSSSGKSTLVECSLQVFPRSCIVERAGLSKKALAHGVGSLAKKILFINEYRCGREAQQFTRLLQSQGQIKHEFTTIKGAERGTKIMERVGTPVVLSTTTDQFVFEDDETRFLSILVDFSAEQNRRIVLARSRKPQTSDCRDLPVWQKATSLLKYKKGDFEHPRKWMEYVAKHLPLDQVRVRRDWDRFLTFCSAVALSRGFGSKERLDICFADYCIAYRILEPVFASTLHNSQSQEHVLHNAVSKLSRRRKRAVSAREIAKELGWKESLVYKHLKIAERRRLIKYESGAHERNLKRVLPIEHEMGRFLPHPHSVLKHNPELGEKVKYIDPFTGKRKVVRR